MYLSLFKTETVDEDRNQLEGIIIPFQMLVACRPQKKKKNVRKFNVKHEMLLLKLDAFSLFWGFIYTCNIWQITLKLFVCKVLRF